MNLTLPSNADSLVVKIKFSKPILPKSALERFKHLKRVFDVKVSDIVEDLKQGHVPNDEVHLLDLSLHPNDALQALAYGLEVMDEIVEMGASDNSFCFFSASFSLLSVRIITI